MGSIQTRKEKCSNTGNGIAVYSFREGKVTPERFIKIKRKKLPEQAHCSALKQTKSAQRYRTRWLAVIRSHEKGKAGANLLLVTTTYPTTLSCSTPKRRVLKRLT